MKTLNQKSGKNTFSKFYILAVLATTIGFAQTEKQTQETSLKAKSDLSSAGAQTNPYFKDNQLAGEMPKISRERIGTTQEPSEVNSEPIEVTKVRTKSNQSNERTTRPNGQDDGNPFPPKSLVKKGSSQIATYDVKANKKV